MSHPKYQNKIIQKGFILPLAIFSLVLASVFFAFVLSNTQLSQKIVLEELKYTQTRMLADSGLRFAYYLASDKRHEYSCHLNRFQEFQLQKNDRFCSLKLSCEASTLKGDKTVDDGNGKKSLNLTARVSCEDGLSSEVLGRVVFY